MTLQLKPEFQRFIDEQISAGRFTSAEEVVEAGLASLVQQELTSFAPGELDRLLAAGEGDLDRGDVYDGESVFREIAALSAARKSGSPK